MPRVLLWVLPLILMIYALIDCAQDDLVERTSVPKAMWIVLIIIFPFVGSTAWLVVSKIARPKPHPSPPSIPRQPPPRAPRRPLAPDDDPDFLRRLDEQARRKRPDTPPDPATS